MNVGFPTATSDPLVSAEADPKEPSSLELLSRAVVSTLTKAKEAFGVTVNDLAVATVAGAVREHLNATGLLPDHPLVASVPMSTTTASTSGSRSTPTSSAMHGCSPTACRQPWPSSWMPLASALRHRSATRQFTP